MKNPRDPQTKAEATAFVSAVMLNKLVLLSPDFQVAIDLSERFSVTVPDVLTYRRELARRA